MNHASGAIAAPDTEVVQVDDIVWQRAQRRGLVQGAVWPVRVVEGLSSMTTPHSIRGRLAASPA
jgi:hypothetical protein